VTPYQRAAPEQPENRPFIFSFANNEISSGISTRLIALD
jgi:hypothetical protein